MEMDRPTPRVPAHVEELVEKAKGYANAAASSILSGMILRPRPSPSFHAQLLDSQPVRMRHRAILAAQGD